MASTRAGDGKHKLWQRKKLVLCAVNVAGPRRCSASHVGDFSFFFKYLWPLLSLRSQLYLMTLDKGINTF